MGVGKLGNDEEGMGRRNMRKGGIWRDVEVAGRHKQEFGVVREVCDAVGKLGKCLGREGEGEEEGGKKAYGRTCEIVDKAGRVREGLAIV